MTKLKLLKTLDNIVNKTILRLGGEFSLSCVLQVCSAGALSHL